MVKAFPDVLLRACTERASVFTSELLSTTTSPATPCAFTARSEERWASFKRSATPQSATPSHRKQMRAAHQEKPLLLKNSACFPPYDLLRAFPNHRDPPRSERERAGARFTPHQTAAPQSCPYAASFTVVFRVSRSRTCGEWECSSLLVSTTRSRGSACD